MIPIKEALDRALPYVIPFTPKLVDVSYSVGFYSNETVFSSVNIPGARTSVMDGFAVNSKFFDLSSDKVYTLNVSHSVYAETDTDHMNSDTLEAVYITTGGDLPACCDAVIPVEDVLNLRAGVKASTLKHIEVKSTKPKTFVRSVGCDVGVNDVICTPGTLIDAGIQSLLISCTKLETIEVRYIPITLISTGDEILRGKVADTNAPMLTGLFQQWYNHQVRELPTLTDDLDEVISTLESQDFNLVVMSGGVSKGDHDYIIPALQTIGAEILFNQQHMKPGKPCTVAYKGRTMYICLPGNPVSCYACFHTIIRPLVDFTLKRPNLATPIPSSTTFFPASMIAQLQHDIRFDRARPEFHRGQLRLNKAGQLVFWSSGIQASSRIASVAKTQGMAYICQDGSTWSDTIEKQQVSIEQGKLCKGSMVEVVLTSIQGIGMQSMHDEQEIKQICQGDSSMSVNNSACRCDGTVPMKLSSPLLSATPLPATPSPLDPLQTLSTTSMSRKEHIITNKLFPRLFVITVSTSSALGQAQDQSGPLLCDMWPGEVVGSEIVPDDILAITNIQLRTKDKADIIVTTGGTGFSITDVTPEATEAVLTKKAPGISQLVIAESLKHTPMGALSRGVAGVLDHTVIVNLPGNPKAIREVFPTLIPVLSHASKLAKQP